MSWIKLMKVSAMATIPNSVGCNSAARASVTAAKMPSWAKFEPIVQLNAVDKPSFLGFEFSGTDFTPDTLSNGRRINLFPERNHARYGLDTTRNRPGACIRALPKPKAPIG